MKNLEKVEALRISLHDWSYCQIWCMAFRPLSLLIARLPACHL